MTTGKRLGTGAVLFVLAAVGLGACSRQTSEPTAQEPTPPAPAAAPATVSGTVVTRDHFVRAESDRMFSDFLKLTGGVNRPFHIRRPTPLDQQTVVRMNRDTIYSAAIIDTATGGTITMPPRDVHGSEERRFLVDHDL